LSTRITSSHDCVILDACCVMNLYASRKMSEIIASIAELVTVTVYVKDVEALFVYKKSKQEAPAEKESVNLQPMIDEGLLKVVDFESEAEKISFVNLTVQRMDDGEAATGAIAIHRNWAIATDDRQSRTVFKREAPHIQLISTPELVKHWVDNAHPEADIVSQVHKDIETRANYWVRVKDPLFDWWQMSQGNV
jgi:predicted nucleic acid-binding protein